MISVKQIKAARALLGWSQKELAKISGVSLATIAQIEADKGNPRTQTLHIIQLSFEKYEIEFSDEPGVRIRREPFSVTVWQGYEAMLNCWLDIDQTLADTSEKKERVLLISCVDDPLWKKFYRKEMLEMYKSRARLGITTLGLLTNPKKNESGWPSKNYRIVPEAATSPLVPYYVYSNKVAIIKMLDPIKIILIANATLAESYRAQFQYQWDNGKKF